MNLQSLKNKLAAGGALLLSAPFAMAQAADPVTGAMTDAGTKVGTYGAALVTLAAVGVGFGVGIKYIKKIKGAA